MSVRPLRRAVFTIKKGDPAEKGAMRNGEAADPVCDGDQMGEGLRVLGRATFCLSASGQGEQMVTNDGKLE